MPQYPAAGAHTAQDDGGSVTVQLTGSPVPVS
jgi:hypothetical protein